ncbi:hypothetical protein O3G_MSEX010518 [Manduca sexta]|uniref:Uncharacterized protein n=1 Tax=Manduca sexta TaxID=7130 RepID=A0A922CTK9_MANSE|nr:hypothetical protein O3G_MSEX010518 [Manduca sexta]
MKFVLFLCVEIILSTAIPISEEDKTVNGLEADRSYQITEDVDDIPDTRPKLPIIANYTVKRPLNLATINNTNEKSNKFSLLQIQSETEHENFFAQFDDKTETNLLSGIKKYFRQFKNEFLNGVQTWIKNTIDSLKE